MDPIQTNRAVYDDGAEGYAAAYIDWQPAEDLVARLLTCLVPGDRAADIGSGSGRDLARLRAAGIDAVGVDQSSGLLAHARAHGPVVEADMRSLPFADGELAGLLSIASIDHIPPPDTPTVLAEFARVLRPGGVAVISTREGDDHEQVDDAGRHLTFWTSETFGALTTDAGLELVELTRTPDTRRPGLWWMNWTLRRPTP